MNDKLQEARELAEDAKDLLGDNKAFKQAFANLQEELLAKLETDDRAAAELKALRKVKQTLESYVKRGPPGG